MLPACRQAGIQLSYGANGVQIYKKINKKNSFKPCFVA